MINRLALLTALIGLLVVTSGCAMPSMKTSKAISAAKKVDLHEFKTVCIVPLSLGDSGAPENSGELWSKKLEDLLKAHQSFSKVVIGSPSGNEDELVVSGVITKYSPGLVHGGGVKTTIKLASATRPDIYSFPAESSSMGVFTGMDFVMESVAMITDLVIKKARD